MKVEKFEDLTQIMRDYVVSQVKLLDSCFLNLSGTGFAGMTFKRADSRLKSVLEKMGFEI